MAVTGPMVDELLASLSLSDRTSAVASVVFDLAAGGPTASAQVLDNVKLENLQKLMPAPFQGSSQQCANEFFSIFREWMASNIPSDGDPVDRDPGHVQHVMTS